MIIVFINHERKVEKKAKKQVVVVKIGCMPQNVGGEKNPQCDCLKTV